MPQKQKRSVTRTTRSSAKTPTYGDGSMRSRREIDRLISDMRVLLAALVISPGLEQVTPELQRRLASLMRRANALAQRQV